MGVDLGGLQVLLVRWLLHIKVFLLFLLIIVFRISLRSPLRYILLMVVPLMLSEVIHARKSLVALSTTLSVLAGESLVFVVNTSYMAVTIGLASKGRIAPFNCTKV
jgi:hypothetical protein